MNPTTETPPPKPRRPDPDGRVLLYDVPWEMYVRLVKAFEGKRNVRLTYDRGSLEIMAPSMEHDGDAASLAHLVEVLTEELGMPVRRGGSVTVKRRRRQAGIEPDCCFWIAHAAQLAGVRRLDLRIHPPPDLAIEVDVTNSSLDKFGVYARLGVPELWRLDGDVVTFNTLATTRRYAAVAVSPTFPGVAPADLVPFVQRMREVADQNLVTRDFRTWVRARPK